MDARTKFGKETIAGVYKSANGFHIMVHRLTQDVLRICSSVLRYAHLQLRLEQQLLASVY
jgi:hypothetical protein